MKRMWNKLRRGEKGQALMLVLILMLLGGLIIAPLLSYMGTGLKAGQVYEERMDELYAADAGIEDALWNLIYVEDPPDSGSIQVNDMPVDWTILGTAERELFKEMLDFPGQGAIKKKAPHSEWMSVGASPEPGVYEVTVTYTPCTDPVSGEPVKCPGPPKEKRIDAMGAWFYGQYEFVPLDPSIEGSATGVPEDWPEYEFTQKSVGAGTAFIWDWRGAQTQKQPQFVELVHQTLRFEFTPSDSQPRPHCGWVLALSDNIFVSWDPKQFMEGIIATAQNTKTGGQTTVKSYIMNMDDIIYILVWEISLQQED